MEFWISVLLTILGYLPGVLYAVYVICSVDPHRHDDDDYVYVGKGSSDVARFTSEEHSNLCLVLQFSDVATVPNSIFSYCSHSYCAPFTVYHVL